MWVWAFSRWSTFLKNVEYGEFSDPYIPTGGSALESADSELESVDSNPDPPKIGVCVQAFTLK